MSFFDFFLSEEKKITKNRHRLTSRDSQPEDREGAARWLAENGSPKALLALLSRFDMKLEHQLNDKAEKEFVYSLVLGLGDKAVKPLRSWLKQARQVSLPLKLHLELSDVESTVKLVFKLLQAELERDDFKPEKKNALLVWLTEHRHDGALEVAAPFVDDFDENVRCSALEVLVNQQDDAAAAILEKRFTNDDEDSNRLRHRVAEVFATRGWPVSDADAFGRHLPDGYVIAEGRVRAR
ncbi:MAG: HEAT repeat domain-containing protein [Alphaproteobacteria bacterium]|nr:HEAT repeat domain-containing protein [Alphaproteobacteria bacterium]